MKSLRAILPAIAVFVPMLTACTHNNGDIGPIFGNWQLTGIESSNPDYKAEMPSDGVVYWAFQSSTVHMSVVSDNMTADNRFGNYRLDDNTLFLDFPDTDAEYGHPLLGLPDQCRLQLLHLSSDRLTLQYSMTADTDITYYFRKW